MKTINKIILSAIVVILGWIIVSITLLFNHTDNLKCQDVARLDYGIPNPICYYEWDIRAKGNSDCYCYEKICKEHSCENNHAIYFNFKQ